MNNKKIGGLIIAAIVVIVILLIGKMILKSDVDTGSDLNLDNQQNPAISADDNTNPANNDTDETSQFNPELDNGEEPSVEGNIFTTMVDGQELTFRYPELGQAVQTGNTVVVTSNIGEELATVTLISDMEIQAYVESKNNVILPSTPVTYSNVSGQAFQTEDPLTAVKTEYVVVMLDDMLLAEVMFQSENDNQLPGAEIVALIESMQY